MIKQLSASHHLPDSLTLCCVCPSEVGGERQESSAHRGAAAARAETPEEASGAAGGGADPHGQHRLHPLLRQVRLRPG